MNFWVKVGIILLIISLIFGTGYKVRDYIADTDELKFQQKISKLESDVKDALNNTRIEYVTTVNTVRVKGDTLIIRVPEWVDDKIFVNKGFIAHHNASVDNATLGAPPEDAMQLSNVSLVDAETVITGNYTRCNSYIKQIDGLQKSIKVYQEKSSKQ